jgi:cation:H+ antiporter
MAFILAGVGLAILLFAGDLLVRGATRAALKLGLPPLIVGLTIVAFGTSAPELLISIDAVMAGAPGLALGNVVGSNTANILLVLGVPALISKLATGDHDVRDSYVQMILASIVFIALCFTGAIVWWMGLLLLALLAFILGLQVRSAVRSGLPPEIDATEGRSHWGPTLMLLLAGLVGLPIGAHIFVDSALEIAEQFGVPDDVIGLTLVALGTSLPELATTVAAAIRRQADVALGNVIGSNLFNLLAICGVASLFGPLTVPPGFLVLDLWIMLGASVLIAPFVFGRGRNMTRRYGVLLTLAYVAYVAVLVGGTA